MASKSTDKKLKRSQFVFTLLKTERIVEIPKVLIECIIYDEKSDKYIRRELSLSNYDGQESEDG